MTNEDNTVELQLTRMIDGLRYVLIDNCTNLTTKAIIWQAYLANHYRLDGDTVLLAKRNDGDPGLRMAFNALLASPNVKPVHRMLVDYHEMLGSRQIKAILVWWNQPEPEGLMTPRINLIVQPIPGYL